MRVNCKEREELSNKKLILTIKWKTIFLFSVIMSFCFTLMNETTTVTQKIRSESPTSQLNNDLVVVENTTFPLGEFGLELECSLQLSDTCFIFAGKNYSRSSHDIAVAKFDFKQGFLWSYTFGGDNYEFITDLIQTNDGGIAFAGVTESYGAGGRDMWFVKLNSEGKTEFTHTYGGERGDEVSSMIQTSDGGFILFGHSSSHREIGEYDSDFWVVKTDSEGEVEWNKLYHERDKDYGDSILETNDGSFGIIGNTMNFGDETREDDIWFVKIDKKGEVVWEKVIGGEDDDNPKKILQNSKGEYYILALTESYTDIEYNKDLWVIQLDNQGNIKWNQTYGGISTEEFINSIETPEGNLAIIAKTYSYGEMPLGWLLIVKPPSNVIVNTTFEDWNFYPLDVYPDNEKNNLILLGVRMIHTDYYWCLLKVHYGDNPLEQTPVDEESIGGFELIIGILTSGLVYYLVIRKRRK